MAFYNAFVISGLLLVTIIVVIQSAPVGQNKQSIKQYLLKSADSNKILSNPTSTTTTTTPVSQSSGEEKKKLYLDDDQLNGLFDDDSDETDVIQFPYVKPNDHILHAKIQETSAKIHNNADKPVDTDDSKVFSDIKMTPNELTNIVRRRRNIKLNDETNRRRKRALSPYDFYDTDSFYDPYADLIERHQYVRPTRSFAPIYWYPSVYERNIRSALEPSFYESSEWPILYSNTLDEDDDDEIPVSLSDDENDYESNRYPILVQSPPNPFDSLQQYNTDDLPIDEDFEENIGNDDDDDDEQYPLLYEKQRPYYTRYGPVETDF